MNDKIEVRHALLKGEPVNTMYGVIELDHDGYVTNLDKLECNPTQLIENVPHFVNGTLFPAERTKPGPAPEADQATPTGDPNDLKGPSAEDAPYIEALKEYLDGKIQVKFNSEGYAEMNDLNEFLRTKNLAAITGTKRKELTDAAGLKQEPK